MLWWAVLALAATWLAFFRQRITICVSDKARDLVWVAHPRGKATAVSFYQAYQYTLTDENGCQWLVSKAAYDQAVPGQRLELRQWVDEWRPVGAVGRYTTIR